MITERRQHRQWGTNTNNEKNNQEQGTAMSGLWEMLQHFQQFGTASADTQVAG